MKKYRIRDVPRGERWKYFWSYYTPFVCLLAVAAVLLGYAAYLVFLKPRTDVSMIWLLDGYDPVCERAFSDAVERSPGWDVNGDGTVRVSISYIGFDAEYGRLDADTRSELAVILSVGDNFIFFADDYAARWMSDNGLLGTWGDFGGREGKDDGAVFAVGASGLPFLGGEGFGASGDVRICIAKPPAGERRLYDAQMAALRELLYP